MNIVLGALFAFGGIWMESHGVTSPVVFALYGFAAGITTAMVVAATVKD